MSYNNYLDVNAGVALLREFDDTAAVIVKHNNPCGVAVGSDILDTYVTARDVDPVSAYGSVVSVNREVTKPLAEEICKTFVEVIVAPRFSAEALAVMKKKDTMRVLVLPPKCDNDELRTIDGGILVQRTPAYQEHWQVITDRDPSVGGDESTPACMESLQTYQKQYHYICRSAADTGYRCRPDEQGRFGKNCHRQSMRLTEGIRSSFRCVPAIPGYPGSCR